MADNEQQFEADIESYLTSEEGGWVKATDAGYKGGFQYSADGTFEENYALDIELLCDFVKRTQPVAWALFEKRCKSDPVKKFYKALIIKTSLRLVGVKIGLVKILLKTKRKQLQE